MKIKLKYYLPIIISALALISGCRNESIVPKDDGGEKTITLSFLYDGDVNVSKGQDATQPLARSADESEEKEDVLTSNDLRFYIFDGNNNTFIYTPDPKKVTLTKKNGTANIYEANFKIPEDKSGKVKMIVLAHYNGENPTDGQTLEDFNSTKLIKTLSKKYDAKSTPIPLWGECSFEASKLSIKTSVNLIRSMAKIGIKIDDKLNDKLEYKIEKIESVRVYRTLNKMALYIDAANIEKDSENKIIGVTKPTIPKDAKFNLNTGGSTTEKDKADEDPLLYTFSGGTTNVESIYVPEKEQSQNTVTTLDNAQAIVLGVKLKNIKETRYYRIDVAKYDKGELKPVKMLSILRNNYYQFSLGGAKNSGTQKPEEALNAPGNVYVSVQQWNEFKSEYELNGQYYFGLKSSHIELQWKKQSDTTVNLSFKMDPNDAKKSFSYAWLSNENGQIVEKESSDLFELIPQLEQKKIHIRTKLDNATPNDKSQRLVIRFLKHQFELVVIQMAKPAQYEIGGKHIARGVYIVRQELDSAKNFVKLRLYAKKKSNKKGESEFADLKGLRYHLSSEKIGGYYIDMHGIFDNIKTDDQGRPYQEVKVPIKGKTTSPKNKSIMIRTDAEEVSFATVEIPVAYIPKRVLGIFGPNSINKLSKNDNFKKFLENSGTIDGKNFGINDSSAVKSERIEYIEIESGLEKSIAKVQPDVIIIGDDYSLTGEDQDILLGYLNFNPRSVSKQGVVISMNTDKSMFDFMKDRLKIFDSGKAELFDQQTYRHMGKNKIRKLYPTYVNIEPKKFNRADSVPLGYRYFIPTLGSDKIVNGPFAYLGAKSWKGDPIKGKYATFPIDTEILKYSGMVPYGSGNGINPNEQNYNYGTTFFRALHYSFVWIGYPDLPSGIWNFKDGKSIAEPYDSHGYVCKKSSGKMTGKNTYVLFPINDGAVFSNIFNWALYQSEYAN